jgi:hypothetical protein
VPAARRTRWRFREIVARLAPRLDVPTSVTPLSPDRYKLQLTISGDTLEKPRLAKDMLSHAVPSGDDAAVLDRALTALLVDLAKKKFADTRPRKSRGCADENDISAAVKRVVYLRDRGRCTYVGPSGHRCEERRFIQFHHLDARSRGGCCSGSGGETTGWDSLARIGRST